MSHLGSFIFPPEEKYLVSREAIFKLRFGEKILLNGRKINPFSYDSSDPDSILKAIEKIIEASEYIFNKKNKLDNDINEFIDLCKKVKKR